MTQVPILICQPYVSYFDGYGNLCNAPGPILWTAYIEVPEVKESEPQSPGSAERKP